MKRVRVIGLLISMIVLLTGCWDQHLMKNSSIIQVFSYDLLKNSKLYVGATVPILGHMDDVQLGGQNRTIFVTSDTPGEARMALGRKIAGTVDTSKVKLLLLGENFARQDIFPYLDMFYRNSRYSLEAELIVVKGNASDSLQIKNQSEPNISRYILNLLESSQGNSIIPIQNIHTIRSTMFDPGEDIILPYLQIVDGSDAANIEGIALFDMRQFSGIVLPPLESTHLQIMKNGVSEENRFTIGNLNNDEHKINRNVTFKVKHLSKKMKVKPDDQGNIHVYFDLRYKTLVTEYPKDNVIGDIPMLKEKFAAYFVDLTNKVVDKLHEANCDAFGIGRQLIAYYPKIWSKLDQKNYYSKVKFHTEVVIETIQSGLNY
ncbi:Ger(x)C family spore germination protein [Paenibacillus albiflavus]|uniref:Ger(X)C family spore germination protein n=1 Tax=Paenibacillus albiflavus TaxID=2545760 RepID=A0A4R4EDN7_9BACL|nr:Ger(x)C family spore germination protein [Paenibacillus albiflavus]TCZ77849.1 Ger(x)C family spore germination protein [Paenibacillus albiflavus]